MIVPTTEDREVVLVKQYKHGVGEVIVEYPAGYVESGEDIARAAARELREETGYAAGRLSFFTKLVSNPTKQKGVVHIFLAEDVKKVQAQKLDQTEDIEVLKLPVSKVIDMIHGGEIWNSGTVAATFLTFRKLGLLSSASPSAS